MTNFRQIANEVPIREKRVKTSSIVALQLGTYDGILKSKT